MDLETAKKINSLCSAHYFFQIGLRTAPSSIAEYSLSELIQARDMINQENENAPVINGTKTFYTTCDDRFLAALYATYHYVGNEGDDFEPVAITSDFRVMAVLQLPSAPERQPLAA